MMIAPLKLSDDQFERANQCKNALRVQFDELADQAVNAGWDEYDVALALADLSERLIETTAGRAGSEADIAIAKALLEIKKSLLTSH